MLVTGYAVCNLKGHLLSGPNFQWTDNPKDAWLFATYADARKAIGMMGNYGLHVSRVSDHRTYSEFNIPVWSPDKYEE